MLLRGMHIQEMAVSACSEGEVLVPLTPKGHEPDTHTCPVDGLVVPTSLNRLELELDRADSKFLKNNLGKHLIV